MVWHCQFLQSRTCRCALAGSTISVHPMSTGQGQTFSSAALLCRHRSHLLRRLNPLAQPVAAVPVRDVHELQAEQAQLMYAWEHMKAQHGPGDHCRWPAVMQHRSSRGPGIFRTLAGAQDCLAAGCETCKHSIGPYPTVAGLVLPKQAPVVSSLLLACTRSSSIMGASPFKHAWELQAPTNPQRGTVPPAILCPTGDTTAAMPGS